MLMFIQTLNLNMYPDDLLAAFIHGCRSRKHHVTQDGHAKVMICDKISAVELGLSYRIISPHA